MNTYLMVSICHRLQTIIFASFRIFTLLNIGGIPGRFTVVFIIALTIALRFGPFSYDFARDTTVWCWTRSLMLGWGIYCIIRINDAFRQVGGMSETM